MNGEYLKKLRKEKGLTQDELAKALGYSDRSVISRIEKNDIHLTQDKIIQYADFFGVSVLDIFGVKDATDEEKEELTQIYNSMTEEKRKHLLAYAKYLLDMS